jgi:acyl dehydratase
MTAPHVAAVTPPTALVVAGSPTIHTVIDVDTRWPMAYSACIDDRSPTAYDTTSRSGCVVHPMFTAALDWTVLASSCDPFGIGLTRGDEVKGIHVEHDLTIHRPLFAPARVRIEGSIVSARPVRLGSFVTFEFRGTDAADATAIWTSTMGMIYLDTNLSGEPAQADRRERRALTTDGPSQRLSGSWTADAGFAHVYTECARIWNPLHTDVAVAATAGLDRPILHGTATLARSITRLLELVEAEPSSVRALGGQFRAPVTLPNELQIDAEQRSDATGVSMTFESRTEQGEPAVRDGYLVLE